MSKFFFFLTACLSQDPVKVYTLSLVCMSHKSLNLQQWLSTAWDFCTPHPVGYLAMSRNTFYWRGGVLLRNLVGRGRGAANHHAPQPPREKSCLVLNGSNAADGKPSSVGYLMSPFSVAIYLLQKLVVYPVKFSTFWILLITSLAASFHMFRSFLWIGGWIQRSLMRFRFSPAPPQEYFISGRCSPPPRSRKHLVASLFVMFAAIEQCRYPFM